MAALALTLATTAKTHRVEGQHVRYTFRVELTDKHGCGFTIGDPSPYLSPKAIERRARQRLPIDSTDLPVSRVYLQRIASVEGARVVGASRWNNTVLVSTADTATLASRLAAMEWVRAWRMVAQQADTTMAEPVRKPCRKPLDPTDSMAVASREASLRQLDAIGAMDLHRQGLRGRGMVVAVLDGGFMNADCIHAFANTRIVAMRDFVTLGQPEAIHSTDHGTRVLSAMAASEPGVYEGSAPEASYVLLRCEDRCAEQLVEEDYWAMAAEWADSVGADIINSSLGYTRFDNHIGDHRYRDMDGRSTLISRTASMLAAKGIVMVASAGNGGMGPWKKIAFPADAFDILTVGATTPLGDNAPFSGVGPTQDGRVKPDVMAPGSPANLISGCGVPVQDIGTSFAAPLVCGAVACLWQALPRLTATEIIDLVRRSGDNHDHPDNVFGYGTPDFRKALELGRALNLGRSLK